jgi:hypothetical protein
MKSVTTLQFRKLLEKLPKNTQNKAPNAYLVWQRNPSYPSINFKKIHDSEPIFSVRIGLGYRALGVLEDDTMIWFWIGSHEAYNSKIDKR